MTRKHHRRTRPATPPTGAAPGGSSGGNYPHRAAIIDPPTGGHGDVTDTHRPGVIDLPTIVTVLYVDLLGPAEWQAFGPGRMAAYITHVAADPRLRVPELVTLFTAARAHPDGCVDLVRMTAAEAFAPLVHMEAMANATVGR